MVVTVLMTFAGHWASDIRIQSALCCELYKVVFLLLLLLLFFLSLLFFFVFLTTSLSLWDIPHRKLELLHTPPPPEKKPAAI